MPLIVHNNFHQHHTHHYPAGVIEQLQDMQTKLDSLLKGMNMISPEVQALLDQAKNSSDVLKSIDTHYNALAVMVGQLQTTIASLQAGSVLSDADKATLSAQVSDLANASSTASADITKNTPLEGGAIAAASTEQKPVDPATADPTKIVASDGAATGPAAQPSSTDPAQAGPGDPNSAPKA